MVTRRNFSLALGAAALLAPFRAFAQPAEGKGPHRLGLLSGGTNIRTNLRWQSFFVAMKKIGYEEGRNVSYDIRFADGRPDLLPKLAKELVAGKPDLIVVTSTSEAAAARGATTVIPIVTIHAGDLIGVRLAESLSRPGGNLTGLTANLQGLYNKRIQLLIEALPSIKRIAMLANPTALVYPDIRRECEQAAAKAGVVLLPTVKATKPEELAAAFEEVKKQRPHALIVQNDVLFFVHRERVIDFAARAALPTMYSFTEDVEAGGLMAYAVDYPDLYSRAPLIVDKVLKGVAPGTIPIEQPTRFEFQINMKAAKKLGMKIPQSLLVQATKVIE